MPKLQVDGIDVAEIDALTAERMTRSAERFGLGKQQGAGGFQAGVQTTRSPQYPMAHVAIELQWFTTDLAIYKNG